VAQHNAKQLPASTQEAAAVEPSVAGICHEIDLFLQELATSETPSGACRPLSPSPLPARPAPAVCATGPNPTNDSAIGLHFGLNARSFSNAELGIIGAANNGPLYTTLVPDVYPTLAHRPAAARGVYATPHASASLYSRYRASIIGGAIVAGLTVVGLGVGLGLHFGLTHAG
jgi:hypothetical protein